MEITQRQKNKFIPMNISVFPGYLFVCFDPYKIIWNKINNTYGVSKILAFNNKLAEISIDLILELKIKYQTNFSSIKDKFKKGESIKFYKGPFSDLIGKVEKIEKYNCIWVLLQLLVGYQRLKIKDIEKNKYKILN